jgi:hypothetical protein
MLGHFHEDFLDHAESLAICCVHYEEYTINIWVEKAPTLSIATLSREIIHNAWHIGERQCYLF